MDGRTSSTTLSELFGQVFEFISFWYVCLNWNDWKSECFWTSIRHMWDEKELTENRFIDWVPFEFLSWNNRIFPYSWQNDFLIIISLFFCHSVPLNWIIAFCIDSPSFLILLVSSQDEQKNNSLRPHPSIQILFLYKFLISWHSSTRHIYLHFILKSIRTKSKSANNHQINCLSFSFFFLNR